MSEARASDDRGLFARLRDANVESWCAFTEHPFLDALATGELDEAAFRYYLIQDYIFLRHFSRAYGLAAYKAESINEIRDASRGLHAIIDIELDLHVSYCSEWGVDAAALDSAQEDEATLAYTRYVLERGMSGDLLDLYVALAPCVVGYGVIGSRLIADSATKFEGNPYSAWIEMYGGEAYHATAAEAVRTLDKVGRARGAEARMDTLVGIFGEATRLEARFWDMGLALTG